MLEISSGSLFAIARLFKVVPSLHFPKVKASPVQCLLEFKGFHFVKL